MKKLTIQWRLTIWNVIVVTAILTVFSAALLILLQHRSQQRAHDDLVEEMQEFVEEIGRCQTQISLAHELSLRFSVHAEYLFSVRSETGETLFHSLHLNPAHLPLTKLTSDFHGPVVGDIHLPELGRYLMLTTAARDSSGARLAVQVLRPRASLDREQSEYFAAVLLAGAFTALATCFAGYLLAKRILSPIAMLTSEAERISAERLSQRLPLTNPNDEFGRLALTLNQLFDRIEQAMDRMKRFTANAAHELRSPVAIMRTEAEVALKSQHSNQDWRSVVEVMFGETVRLGELVDQLLELSRHDAGLDVIPLEPCDEVPVHALLADVVAMIQLPAAQKQVNISLGPIPPWNTPGDDVRLGRLFHNLVDNALKYTPVGGEIRVTARVNGPELQIQVHDSGPGIPTEYLRAVFERFFRVDSARNRQAGGSGLGLAICRAISEAHHGKIEASNQSDGGACFVVTLPGRPASADEECLETVEV